MQLAPTLLLLLPFLGGEGALASAVSPHARSDPQFHQTTITVRIPPSPHLPSPHALPASTRATLSTLGRALAAPLSVANTFVFGNVTAGSYLLDVHCATHAFAPLRVDVLRPVASASASGESNDAGGDKGEGGEEGQLRVAAWETYRGNDWGNKGEAVKVVALDAPGQEGKKTKDMNGVVLDARVIGEKGYFMERSKCA